MPLESEIQILSNQTSSQIAAGEVVERPSHLLKELIENSIDAKATKIELSFDHSGRTIIIKDNGVGIKKNELELALQRHATSKIKFFKDLLNLKSFGFRGEALASASAISKLTLTSCRNQENKSAYQLVSHFGKLEPIKEVAGEPGTLISIENLFSNVPARLKFLKSETSEFQHIKKTLKALALSHPEINFYVKAKDKLLYLWPKTNLLSRAKMVLERNDLFYNESDLNGVNVKVTLGSPNKTLSHSRGLWFFILNRWIQDKTIQAALMQAYNRLLMKKEFPVACVFLSCKPSLFDVNIHPNKSQVKFQDSSLIFKAVYRCIQEGLSKAFWLNDILPQSSNPSFDKNKTLNLEPKYQKESTDLLEKEPSQPVFPLFSKEMPDVSVFEKTPNKTQFKSSTKISDFFKEELKSDFSDSFEKSFKQNPNLNSLQVHKGFNYELKKPYWSSLSIIGQVKKTYIVSQSEKSVLFLDQHAVHERVNYERYKKIWKNKEGFKRQNFLLPYDIELKEENVKLLNPKLNELLALGLQADVAGPSLIIVRSAHPLIKPSAFRPLFELLIKEIENYGESFAFERVIEDIIASISCHSSIRAGQTLSHLEMKALLTDMDEFPSSSFCPHGRPVFVEYPFHRLEKDFKRIL